MTRKPRFDATISLGHVLTVLSFVIGGFVAYTNIQVEITKLQLGIENFGADFAKLSSRVSDLETENNQLKYDVLELKMRQE